MPPRIAAAEGRLLDAEYQGVNDGSISATVTAPSGAIEDVPMTWTVENDGEYRGRFVPTGPE